MLLHATSFAMNVWSDISAGTSVASWEAEPGQEIVSAQICGDLVILGQRQGSLVILTATENELNPAV